MDTPTITISELCDEHRVLEAQAAQMLAIVSTPRPDPASIAAIRWSMAQALRAHCVHEDSAVYERLLASGDMAASAVAWRYRREYGGLAKRFAAYINDWPVARIGEDWEQFGEETERVMAALAGRILLEERVLYAHALRVDAWGAEVA